jgi:quercetin dioxygenase-like cupin family protein
MSRAPMFLTLALGAFALAGAAQAQVLNSADLKWGPAPPGLPANVKATVLYGDPTKAGPFVIRAQIPAGGKVPAHHHPTDELVTVLTGDLTFGMGDKLDMAKGSKLKAGGFFRAEANMNHYVFTKAGATVQISAEGPFQITYVNPADDPRKP